MDYCGISAAGAVKLAQLVAIPACAVETLSLQGNTLRDDGLRDLSQGLARSQHLVTLNIADNAIRHVSRVVLSFELVSTLTLRLMFRTPKLSWRSGTRCCAANPWHTWT